jgi:hypothetical protein
MDDQFGAHRVRASEALTTAAVSASSAPATALAYSERRLVRTSSLFVGRVVLSAVMMSGHSG